MATAAAVVGILIALFVNPMCCELRGAADVFIPAAALVALMRFRAPPWLVVAGAAAAGQILCSFT